MMKRLIWAVAVAVAVGGGFAVVASAGAESAGRYRLATATSGDVEQTVSVSGTVDHVNRADLAFGSDGTVASLTVAAGDAVSAGQELGTLDTASLRAAVDKAAAELADAEASLSAASASPDSAQDELTAAQQAAAAALTAASDALAAQQTACADPASAACAEAVSATAVAQSAVRDAQEALQQKMSAPSSPDQPVADVEAEVAEATVKLTEAQQSLAGATLTSPIAGTVASVSATAGDAVTAGQAVVVVVGEGAATVTATVPVERVGALEVGQQAAVTPLGTSTEVPGTVTRVGTLPDATAEEVAYPVTVTVADPPDTMAAGSSATATITVAAAEDVLTVPTSAIHRGIGTTVTVLTGDQTAVVAVTLGAVGPTRTEVTEGLSAGDQVVLADLDAPVPTGDQQSGPGGLNGRGGPVMRMRPMG